MRNPDHDRLLTELAGLATDAPADLLDRVAARWVRVPAPIGDLFIAFTDHGIAQVRLDEADLKVAFRQRAGRPLLPGDRPPAGLLSALRSGQTKKLRYDLRGVSAFQRDVLKATQTIPPGQVRPYAWVAEQIGRLGSVRAVGTALRRNPVPVLIPCHRVTRSDGEAGDYVFGANVKESLLRAEDVNLDEVRALAGSGIRYMGSDTTGIVCFPTCPNARRITPAHRRGFRSLPQAAAAGYRPCRQCRPAPTTAA